jgi:hypothetical protein
VQGISQDLSLCFVSEIKSEDKSNPIQCMEEFFSLSIGFARTKNTHEKEIEA